MSNGVDAHRPDQSTTESSGGSAIEFAGFQPLTANYVYCPNQFFDVCLKSKSRGMVRVVAFILRQTLGWLDKDGTPIHQTVKVSYRDLIEKAGISRGAISSSIQAAVELGFIDCVVKGRAKRAMQASQSAEYTIRWGSGSEYNSCIEIFDGFFAGEGNRTPVPNSFFDTIVPNEKLSVTKVVGTVIRHTVGYQTQFGGRKQIAPLSCTYIQNYACIKKRKAVVDAIHHAESNGFIKKVKSGQFSPRKCEQAAAVYSIRWQGEAKDDSLGSKKEPDEQRFKKAPSIGSGKSPGDRFKKGTSIEKTKLNEKLKQQVAAESASVTETLVAIGFDAATARRIAESFPTEQILNQTKWLADRKPRENKVGMLRMAIEQNWHEPQHLKEKRISRERQMRDESANAIEEVRVKNQKLARRKRREDLMQIWQTLKHEEQQLFMQTAIRNESSKMKQEILSRKKLDHPSTEFLDVLAVEKGLPTVTLNSCHGL